MDPEREWTFEQADTASKSFNSPFYGWKLRGRAVMTIVGGKIAWRDEKKAVMVGA
jgi:dihydroorotase